MSDFDRFIELGRAWTDRPTFWRHLEGRPVAWVTALERQPLADAVPRPAPSAYRLIEAKRACIRSVLGASAGRHHAA
jgi:hypothetical protein